MARSRLFSVVSVLLWANCCATSETATPLPTAGALTPCGVEANRSANSAREPLKPVVATFARLLAVTERSWLAALSPVRAILKDMKISLELNSRRVPALQDRDDGAQRYRAAVGQEVDSLGGRVERDALYLADHHRVDRLGRAVHRGIDLYLIGSGGGRAGGRLAVPAELRQSARLGCDVEIRHRRAGGIADRHHDFACAGRRGDRAVDRAAGCELRRGARSQHRTAEQGGTAHDLRGLQRALHALHARHLAHALELRDELGRI